MRIEENAIYTYKDVQELLGIKKTALSKLIADKKIHVIRVGKEYRFLGKHLFLDLEDLLNV